MPSTRHENYDYSKPRHSQPEWFTMPIHKDRLALIESSSESPSYDSDYRRESRYDTVQRREPVREERRFDTHLHHSSQQPFMHHDRLALITGLNPDPVYEPYHDLV
ncbi:uncharacterized protein RHO25_006746 [Cercospora beticola]|uniref:Uncharacterized protein n=1 Tax=Cercospora beticola TaxID=122368 RepID=A0ABZ0NRA0_CERBT|nr:hypothetical protein RHO25_006746 [Cercospora beticola]CAK1363034.1 unnamed protein product [Cercospora beticola]